MSDEDATIQQIFLQMILAAQVIPEEKLELAVQSLNSRYPEAEQRSIENLLIPANEALDAIDMELLKVRNDFDKGNFYYILINKAPLPPGLDRRFLSAPQAAQFKDILDIMFSDSRCEGVDPVNDLKEIPGRDEIIDKLLLNQWLEELSTSSGASKRVFISMRCLYELQSYLVDRYADKTLHRCMGCEQWLLAGKLCSNTGCSARLHDRCYNSYFRSRGEPTGICTKCASPI